MYKKVGDIKESIENRINNYLELINSDVKCSLSITVKNAELSVKYFEKGRYPEDVATIKASVEDKGEDYLTIDVSIKNLPYRFFKGIDEEHIDKLLEYICLYWKEYKEFKNFKYIFFKYGSHENNSETTQRVFDKMKLVEIDDANSLFSFRVWSKIFREEKMDKNLKNTMFIHEEIINAKQIFTTFIEQPSNCQTLFKIFHTHYYFENATFKIGLDNANNHVLLIRENIDNVVFEIKPGVMMELLNYIEKEMRLSNLIHPPIHQTKEFLEKFLEIRKEDKFIEDIVLNNDEKLGKGITEKEMILISQKVDEAFINYQEFGVKKKINAFELKSPEIDFFKEHFDTEFTIYKVVTLEYFWFIMISRKTKDIWFFPNKEDFIPEDAKQLSLGILERRTNPDVMNRCSDLMKELTQLNNQYNNYQLRSALDSISGFAKSEFGQKWQEKLKI